MPEAHSAALDSAIPAPFVYIRNADQYEASHLVKWGCHGGRVLVFRKWLVGSAEKKPRVVW